MYFFNIFNPAVDLIPDLKKLTIISYIVEDYEIIKVQGTSLLEKDEY
ncbi:hypothetical protein [Clostridium sartagoforme]|nr:hypothetical protein [Clostridium sartagoforme]